MVIAIEALFPGLMRKNYRVTSPATDVYNCIAWAAQRVSEWWWPFRLPSGTGPTASVKDGAPIMKLLEDSYPPYSFSSRFKANCAA